MKKSDTEQMYELLYNVMARLDSPEEARRFLDDLCTYKEVEQMAQRLYAAKRLLAGQTYAQIIADIDISSATLSRVSRCVRRGSGGYTELLGDETAKTDSLTEQK